MNRNSEVNGTKGMNLRLIVTLAVMVASLHLYAQSLGDIACQQQKKKQTNATVASSNATPTPLPTPRKIYTNDDFSGSQDKVGSGTTQKTDAGSEPAAKDSASNGRCGEGASPASSSMGIKIDTKVPARVKLHDSIIVDHGLQNTSANTILVTETDIFTGPCNYHQERSSGFFFKPGGFYDNFLSFSTLENGCPGTYKLEIRICNEGQLLTSATLPFQVE